MLIGIDGNEANVGERVGVNVWAFEILRGLRRIRRQRRTRWVIYLSRPPKADMPEEGENWRYRVIGPGKFWTRWRLPLDLYFHRYEGYKGSDLAGGERSDPLRPDVFFSLSHYAPKWAPMPRVVSIMDLSFLKFPEAFKPAVRWQLTNWTAESVRNAAHIITISEFNKREIVKNYGYPEEKITVIYPGVSKVFKGPALPATPAGGPWQGRALSKYGILGKYLLFVGTRQPKKNLGRLIEAFGLVKKRFSEIQLVIVGKTWSQFTDMKDQIHPSSRRPSGLRTAEGSDPSGVRYVGYVPADDLPELMAGAEALVLPSLYEGFGIPAVEAISMGTPVLASDVTSLPEIIGGAGILFDPYEVKSIAEAIEQLLSLKTTDRQRLIEKGKIRAGKFDWDKAADSIMRSLIHIADARSLDFARDDEIK